MRARLFIFKKNELHHFFHFYNYFSSPSPFPHTTIEGSFLNHAGTLFNPQCIRGFNIDSTSNQDTLRMDPEVPPAILVVDRADCKLWFYTPQSMNFHIPLRCGKVSALNTGNERYLGIDFSNSHRVSRNANKCC